MALFDFLTRKKKKEKEAANIAPSSVVVPQQKQRVLAREKRRSVSDRALACVIRPHVTERSRENSQKGVYMFRVARSATKPAIKQAIEALYQVTVARVRVMRVPAKPRRRGLTRGTKKGYKKAAVALRQGDHIELFS